LAALVRRERTGEGATVKVSMLEALAEWMQAPLLNAHAIGHTPPRTARRHAVIAPYGTFRLADLSEILLAVQNNAEFERLCRIVLIQPELAADVRFATNNVRIQHVDELEAIVNAGFRSASPEEIRQRLRDADLAIASVNSLADVWQHEQLRARDRFVTTELPGGGSVETLRLPIDMDGLGQREAIVPAFGQA
jgi:itaconate CoA-transferase